MAVTTIYPFTDPEKYDFNASDIEIVSGKAQVKKVSYDDELLFSNFNVDGNAVRSVGSSVGVVVGDGAIIDGQFEGSEIFTHIEYEGIGNIGTNSGCIRVLFTPEYSGAPPGNTSICSYSHGNVDTKENSISILHSGSGAVFVQLWDALGVAILDTALVIWNAVAGQQYQFELNWDCTSGPDNGVFLFIDGVAQSPRASPITTRDAATIVSKLRCGADYISASRIRGKLDNFQVYGVLQNKVSFAPVFDYPLYAAGSYDITPKASVAITTTAMSTMSEVATRVVGTDIKYVLNVNGIDKYWDEVAWSNSLGFAQSNTIQEVNTNVSTLDMSLIVTLLLKSYLSTDGNLSPQLDNLSAVHEFAVPPGSIGECLLRGDFFDAEGEPVVNAKVTFIPNAFWYGEAYISKARSVRTDVNGHMEVSIVETEVNDATMNIKVEYEDGSFVRLYKDKTIFNLANDSLVNVINS